MSVPTADLHFDDSIDRSWSQFAGALVARVAAVLDEPAGSDRCVGFVRERGDTHADTADLTFRRLHDGVICAVIATDQMSDETRTWSRTGPGHLTRTATADSLTDLVDSAITLARIIWGITHPSFLRPIDPTPERESRSRAAAMADHPSGGIGRIVRRVVSAQLSGVVEVDHHQAVELRYPDAVVHLQAWEVERSALLWTAISTVAESDGIARARQIMQEWPDLDLIVDGATVDVELAVDLSDRPSRSMAAALDRWHEFMENGHAAVMAAVVLPDNPSDSAVAAPLRAILRRHRDGGPMTADEIDTLLRLDRTVLLESLDLCRRQSLSWMSWAAHRTSLGDSDGGSLACTEARMWDSAYATVSAALHRAVTPTT